MLIKVGSLYLTVGSFHFDAALNRVRSLGETIQLTQTESEELTRKLEEVIADQANLTAQAKNLEEQAEKFAAETKRVQEYEKQLRAEAQAAGLGQNKSGIITPGMMMPRRGRG